LPDYPRQFDRALYSDAYLLGHASEQQVQRAILDLLVARRIPAIAVDAGAAKLRGAFFRAVRGSGMISNEQAAKMIAQPRGAAYAGLSDIVGTLRGGRALFIECKQPAWLRIGRGNALRVERDAGEPTGEQLAFLDSMCEAGALCMVAWSPDDVERALGAK
jgi:hypothetical protein